MGARFLQLSRTPGTLQRSVIWVKESNLSLCGDTNAALLGFEGHISWQEQSFEPDDPLLFQYLDDIARCLRELFG